MIDTILPVAVIVFFCVSTPVATHGTTHKKQSPAVFASIWNLPSLYENKDNPYVQSFALVGRYHGQYWSADSDSNYDNGWENRRIYVGFNARFFKQFILEAQIAINDDFDPVYKGIFDAFIKWENADNNFALSVGRMDFSYSGMERTTSSKKIKTMERALIVNMVMPGEVVGGYAKGMIGGLTCQAGLFSGSIEDEFTSFEGGFGALLGFVYELPLFYDQGSLHLDYFYNNGDENNNAFKSFTNIFSLWHEGRKGPFEIGIDFTAADGVDEQSDVFGLTLLPAYDLIQNLIFHGDKLQLALRYHYASSSDNYGLKFNNRYEQSVASGMGDSYNSYYLGLNYYIYQQKLKLMVGLEYFDMTGVAEEDEKNTIAGDRSVDGWELISGVRLYF